MSHSPILTTNRDIQRLVEFDFLRATEMAALNAMQWIGKGDKEAADAAACDAIRGMFDLMNIRGEVTIGEGVKDEAPGIFKGEHVGTWAEGSPRFDVALDPVDGTTNTAKGMANALSCIAAVTRADGSPPALLDIPAFYLEKLSYCEVVRKAWMADPSLPLSLDAPVEEVIKLTASLTGKKARDVVVMVLDRPRNMTYVEQVRKAGASLRMVSDGDITAALSPAMLGAGVDLFYGIGGAPEGVLAAAGLRCLGGGMQARVWPRDEEERKSIIASGWTYPLDKVFRSRDLAFGDDIFFCATGICDGPFLRGVRVTGHVATTHSVLMRVKSRTIRFLETQHNLQEKTIHLRSTRRETTL